MYLDLQMKCRHGATQRAFPSRLPCGERGLRLERGTPLYSTLPARSGRTSHPSGGGRRIIPLSALVKLPSPRY